MGELVFDVLWSYVKEVADVNVYGYEWCDAMVSHGGPAGAVEHPLYRGCGILAVTVSTQSANKSLKTLSPQSSYASASPAPMCIF